MFGVGGVGVVDGAVLCVNVEFVPQGSASGGHGHCGFGGHAAVRGHALCTVAGGPVGRSTNDRRSNNMHSKPVAFQTCLEETHDVCWSHVKKKKTHMAPIPPCDNSKGMMQKYCKIFSNWLLCMD